MKRKQSIAVISTSALAAGVAQGAVTYSGLVNTELPCPKDWLVAPAQIDMNGDFVTDFNVGFDGASVSNWRKPFIDNRFTSGAAALTQQDTGVPVTPFGTMIDANFLAPSTNNLAYLAQEGPDPFDIVGDWPLTATTEGYVGVELYDGVNSVTNFGWIHLIYNPTANPPNLTLVDWGYETTAGLGIPAGSTNTLGAPDIYAGPQSQTVPTGATVEMKVLALGKPFPAYQWRAGPIGSGTFTNLINGGSISGATTATLTINGAASANVADYVVVITNMQGAVTSSPPATLTVLPPVISPSVQTLFSGRTAHFDVTVGGGLSPTYQWRKNTLNLSDGGNISGATTAHLLVSSLTPPDAGNYDVLLTIGSTTVTSVVAALTVLPAESESTYEAVLLDAGPIAYYRLNETGNPATSNLMAWDNAGAFNGTYGVEVSNGFAGVAGPRTADGFPGFAPNNAAALFTPDLPGARIDVAPWKLNTDTLTLAVWLNPAADQNGSAGVVYSVSSNKTIAGLHYYYQANGNTGRVSVGYNWRDELDFFWDPAISPPDGQWSFVALVVEPTIATIYIFNTNGLTSAVNDGSWWTNSVPPRVPIPFDVPEQIGTDISSTSGSQNFNGAIDEVAVFKKALTQDQLQTIYNAALGILPPVTLQATRSGTNIQLTWALGRLLEATKITGPWTTNFTAASPYSTPATGAQKFYRVLVH